MKKITVFLSIISLLFVPSMAFADASSTVNVHTEGSNQSTTCVNGNCTTTGSSGKSTVCINGNCTTSDTGDVNYNSDDGHTQVHINTNTDTVTGTPQPSADPTEDPEVSEDVPSITPNPTIHAEIAHAKKKIAAARKHVQKVQDAMKEHMKDHDAAISTFVKGEMDSMQKLMDNLFK